MYLGIELGSTRIKGVVLNNKNEVIVSKSFHWETSLIDGYWSYDLALVWQGMQEVIKKISSVVDLAEIEAIGISAMMHGMLAFNKDDALVLPFRTWKNENTKVAAEELSNLFAFNIPLRWTVAHIYDLVLNNRPLIKEIVSVHTLASYVHYKLTGENYIGIGDASGMFPVNPATNDYDEVMLEKFFKLTNLDLRPLLPKIAKVGTEAGRLTKEGRDLLGVSNLKIGTLFAPPEGDAQTGMVATNALTPKTGNVSAGTSVFAMLVLDKPLKAWYPEIDIVLTPSGDSVAMVHANECTSLIDPWISLFGETLSYFGNNLSRDDLYTKLYEVALKPATKLGAFMKDKLVLAISELEKGMNILKEKEGLSFDFLVGHGGYFKIKDVGRIIMSETLNIPIKTLDTAAEGGAWGIAVLAHYRALNALKPLDFHTFINNIFKGEK